MVGVTYGDNQQVVGTSLQCQNGLQSSILGSFVNDKKSSVAGNKRAKSRLSGGKTKSEKEEPNGVSMLTKKIDGVSITGNLV